MANTNNAINVNSPEANPTHGPRASVKAIPYNKIVKGMTHGIIQVDEPEAPLDFKARASVIGATINKNAPVNMGLPMLDTTPPPTAWIPKGSRP